jgi:hypothetical protein
VYVRALANNIPQASSVPEGRSRPAPLVLAPPSPNPLPAGSALSIRFRLSETGTVRLDLFDIRGRRVAGMEPVSLGDAGEHVFTWSPPVLPSGVYSLRVVDGRGTAAARQMVLLR